MKINYSDSSSQDSMRLASSLAIDIFISELTLVNLAEYHYAWESRFGVSRDSGVEDINT